MLKGAAGIIVIPKDSPITEFDSSYGKILSFEGISYEPVPKGDARKHKFRFSMFLKREEIESWRNKVKPGQHFLITCVEITAYSSDDNPRPIPNLRVKPWNMYVLKKPVECATGD